MQGSVDARAAELESRLHKVAHLRIVRDDESRAFWDAARDLRSLDSARHNCVWRILLPATHAARLVNVVGGEAVYEWGGSELFIGMGSVQAAEEAGRLRMMADHAGGSACLFRAPIEIRQTLGAFQPRPKPLQDLMERIRQMFDPAGILNPGKLASAQ
jgi:glycolate oxidase FAD binding subunit